MLTIEAPPPWLPNALSCTFEVTVDAENVQIEQVELKKAIVASALRTESGIHKWMHDRINHPLHGLDVGGLVWGVGQWFNAAVERAKILRWIDLEFNQAPQKGNKQRDEPERELTRETCIELAIYLDDTQRSAIDAKNTVSVGGKKFKKKLLLDWNIDLDWAGALTSNVEISTSGIPPQAEPGVKTVFESLIPRLGVKEAFANVWSLIHGEDEALKMGYSKSAVRNRGVKS